jgi:outer membrane receptor protein involved in Fe transport
MNELACGLLLFRKADTPLISQSLPVMSRYFVQTSFYQHRGAFAGIFLTVWTCLSVPAQTVEELPEVVVLAERSGSPGVAAALADWDREALLKEAPRTVDEMLAREPSFSLYRRQSSLFGNPTSAGVSLRNTGATAASRTLVLLDGIPQNDPFGGWVYWARYDPATLDSIRIVPFAQSAVWGNQSPAGVIHMSSHSAFEERHTIRAGGGSQGTLSGSMVHVMSNTEKTRSVSFSAFGLHTDGFYAVPPEQRGSIDRKLGTDVFGGDLKFAWAPAPGLLVEPMISYYHEERGNGTPLTGNSTEALDFSLRITGEMDDWSWQALAYHQRREFQSVFSSLDPARTMETLALNQYDVPSRSTGGALTLRRDDGGRWSFTGGADARAITGATHEDVGTFRRREAGGEQAMVGIFGLLEYQPDELTRIALSARLDGWQLTDGRRIETSLANGALLREDLQPDRSGIEPSASLELSRTLSQNVETRLSAGTSYRLPSLNELHRPFRVRNDIVEANPGLDPERFFSLEGGVTWKPVENFTLRTAVYHHWISDAIANVPVTDPAEIADIFGVIPPGGTGAQRRNVGQARVYGVEAGMEWLPVEDVTFDLRGLWSQTEFSESPDQPLLKGKPFPQAPELRLIASGEWRATERLSLFAGWEYGSSQFDDALAQRTIPDYHSVRIGASWRVKKAIVQVRVENLFNEQIQTGLSGDGIRTVAAPRSLWLGVEWRF